MHKLAPAVLVVAALQAQPSLAQPRAISAHGDWGAFRDGDTCYAVAMATGMAKAREPNGFVTVSAAPSARRFNARLGAIIARGSIITLTLGQRRFRLMGGGDSAWSASPADDRAIVGAMRSAATMTIAGRDIEGRRFRERYRLGGAPTAMDAATAACR